MAGFVNYMDRLDELTSAVHAENLVYSQIGPL